MNRILQNNSNWVEKKGVELLKNLFLSQKIVLSLWVPYSPIDPVEEREGFIRLCIFLKLEIEMRTRLFVKKDKFCEEKWRILLNQSCLSREKRENRLSVEKLIKGLACGILKIAFENLKEEKGLKRMLMKSENERMSKNQFEDVESKSDNDDNLFESDSESMSEEKEKIERN